jgi:hypothetical protein
VKMHLSSADWVTMEVTFRRHFLALSRARNQEPPHPDRKHRI